MIESRDTETSAHPTAGWNAAALAEIQGNTKGKPILFTNATVRSLDPAIGDVGGAAVLLGGPVVVGVGPGIVTAADDDGAIVVDCSGMTIMPAVIDLLALSGHRPSRNEQAGTLKPGNCADLAVLEDRFAPTTEAGLETLTRRPRDAAVLIAKGRVLRWAGRDLGAPSHSGGGGLQVQELSGDPRLGVWIDESDFLHQELTADGRYDETRGGRSHAFQGRFWISGDRIDYVDDLGFWAFGEFRGDELHHAGYTMRQR